MSQIKSRLLSVATVMVGLASAAPAHADECKAVDISVKNAKSVKILALSVEYKFANDNTWRSEAFPNTEVDAGGFKTVATNQNLAGGEGNKLLSIKLHFKAWCGDKFGKGSWGPELVSATDSTFDDTSKCVSNSGRSYRVDVPSTDVCS
jgi:hypothetical protein